nr:hypothetical protein JVH1_8471 [Rhodococcus sp. JVH1]
MDSRPWVHVLLRSIEDRVALAGLGTGMADLCECGFPLFVDGVPGAGRRRWDRGYVSSLPLLS